MTVDWPSILASVEDRLFVQLELSVWERVLYYHLLRRTRLLDASHATFSVASLATSASMGESTVREALRSLDQKGCIVIRDRSGRGHSIEVRLPAEIPSLIEAEAKAAPPDLESLDFYTDRRLLDAFLEREGFRCFYSLRQVTRDTCVLDHVVPLVNGGDNSYRNIVVAAHDINALKQQQEAEDFLRQLFRKGFLSPSELEGRLEALRLLKVGKLVPKVRKIAS